MSKEIDSDGIENRQIRIELENGDQITGQVNINRGLGHDRLSDLVGTNQEQFLVISNVTLYKPPLNNPTLFKAMFVNKDHILWAIPEEDHN